MIALFFFVVEYGTVPYSVVDPEWFFRICIRILRFQLVSDPYPDPVKDFYEIFLT